MLNAPKPNLHLSFHKDMPKVHVVDVIFNVYESKDNDSTMPTSFDPVDITALPNTKNLSSLKNSELCDFCDSIIHPPWLIYYDRSPGPSLARNYGYFVGARDLLTSRIDTS